MSNKIETLFRYIFLLLKIYILNINIKLGKKIRIYQKVIINSQGFISIGDKCFLGYKIGGGWDGRSIELQTRNKEAKIIIKNNVGINNGLFICALNFIEIGNNCLIGNNVTMIDHNGHGIKVNERRTRVGTIKSIKICDNVWIGNNVIILPGVEIGENTIIGAGAVVFESIPANKIAYGNPCKVYKDI